MLQKLLLFTFLFLTLPQTVNAYWLESKSEPFSLREREHAPPTAEKTLLTLQDNFELFSDKNQHTPFLLPYSDHFIPADIIDVNVPIFSLFSHSPLPAKDPLVNLLYANLRVKKLLEEYAEVQQRAKDLLGNESSMRLGKINISTGDDREQKNTGKITENSHSLNKELSELQNSLGAIRMTGNIPFTMHNQTTSSSANPNEQIALSINPDRKTEASINPPTSGRDISPQNIGKITGAGASQHIQSTQGAQTQSNTSKNQNRDSYSGNLIMPWYMDLPSRLFNYLLTHPIETFLLSLGILILFNIIFGTRFH